MFASRAPCRAHSSDGRPRPRPHGRLRGALGRARLPRTVGEDLPHRVAVTDSDPIRAPPSGVNDRHAARPITLSPSNAHSRATIGPQSTPPAPDWLRLGEPRPRPESARPERGTMHLSAGVRTGPPCGPRVTQCSPNTPSPVSPARREHVAPRPRGWGAARGTEARRGLGPRRVRVRLGRFRATGPRRGGAEVGGGGDAASRPSAPRVPGPPTRHLRRAPAQVPEARRRRAASPHWRRRAESRGAAPTLIGLGGAAKLSAHVACPRGDGRG